MKPVRHAFLAVAAIALIGAPTPAQVSPVPNTGCPSAAYPQHSGSARLGQPFQFSWSCVSWTALAILGTPSGGGISFYSPLTCVPGPCVLYPGPIGNEYIAFPIQGTTGNWTITIPNDSRLLSTSWALQCGCFCT